jgi:toxin ParE1/3/4
MAVRILPSAHARLLEIWDYAEREWGVEQADRYVREIVAAVQSIPMEAHRIRHVKHKSLLGVSYLRHRHHYIFFRMLERGEVGVISILHENMDIPSRLKEDAESKD